MTGDDVARYLKLHPEFFDDYAELLSTIEVRHPHGGRAIALSERQLLQLRERNRMLEIKLRELVSFGEENDAISERLHQATLALITADSLDELFRRVYRHLQQDFTVPQVAMRIWPRAAGERQEFAAVTGEVKAFAESLVQPYCSPTALFETADWFPAPPGTLQSFAYVALRSGRSSGLLALASTDPKRFYPEMGTLYLKRLGDVVAAALSRWLDR
jgi:uncharacterized protein YigA (DUF484 family)